MRTITSPSVCGRAIRRSIARHGRSSSVARIVHGSSAGASFTPNVGQSSVGNDGMLGDARRCCQGAAEEVEEVAPFFGVRVFFPLATRLIFCLVFLHHEGSRSKDTAWTGRSG